MAHIDSLAEELLSLIFHATFEEIKASSVSNWKDIGTLPDLLNILLVSSHWNRVAVATPSLWTFIVVDRKGFECARERVKRDLERSKGCPLDVVVQVYYLAGAEELSAFDSLFEEIAQHAHRWQTLRFHNLTDRAINVLEQHLPGLVSLSIIGNLGGRTLKLSTPLLQKYTAPSGNSDLISFEDPLPIFTHLTHGLTSRNAPIVLQHLRRSQRTLTALTLVCPTNYGTQFRIQLENGAEFIAENLDLSLPTLTEYTVKFGASPWGWNALRIAHMPHLRRLDVHWSMFQSSNPNNTVPFTPQLTSLNIFAQNSYGFKDAAPPLAAATPNVKEVSLVQSGLRSSPYEPEWFPPLLHPSQDPLTVAWPRLEILRLHGMAIRVLDDLRRIPLGRPAFRRLSVDSTCWERSKAVGKDLNALREYFDVGIL